MPIPRPPGHSLGPLLTDYVDGALPPSAARAVGEHVRGCDSCGAELASLVRLRAALRSLRSPPPNGATRARLTVAFRARGGLAIA